MKIHDIINEAENPHFDVTLKGLTDETQGTYPLRVYYQLNGDSVQVEVIDPKTGEDYTRRVNKYDMYDIKYEAYARATQTNSINKRKKFPSLN